jgi:hypothetical protein
MAQGNFWSGLGNIFSGGGGGGQGGGQGGGYLSYLDPADQRAARGQGWINLGAGLLGAAGPSPFPTSVGQGLAVGGPAMMQAMNQYGANAFRGKLAKMQLQGLERAEKLATNRAAAREKWKLDNPKYANMVTGWDDAGFKEALRLKEREAWNKVFGVQPLSVDQNQKGVDPSIVQGDPAAPSSLPLYRPDPGAALQPAQARTATSAPPQPQPIVPVQRAPLPQPQLSEAQLRAQAVLGQSPPASPPGDLVGGTTPQQRRFAAMSDNPAAELRAFNKHNIDIRDQYVRNRMDQMKFSSDKHDVLRKEYSVEAKNMVKLIEMGNAATDILNKGGDLTGIDQVEILYRYITALDQNSAVREGEIDLASSIASIQQQIGVIISKAASDGTTIIPSDVAKKMAIRVRELADQAQKNLSIKSEYYSGLLEHYGIKNLGLPPKWKLKKLNDPITETRRH